MPEKNDRNCLSLDERIYFYYQLLCFLYLLFFFSPSDIRSLEALLQVS